jgi:hypothetical protein
MEPEAINARNLERLFRDSVADRRALLQVVVVGAHFLLLEMNFN